MTDTDPGQTGLAQQNGGGEPASIRIVSQFVRDVSFENPRVPDSLRSDQGAPQIELGVELNARGREDGLFEIDLKLSAGAKRGGEAVFHAEVVYGGLFQVNNVPKEAMEQVLLIECPRYLFPFARRIVADLTGEGGFPPLQLDPIDFAAVYEARRNQVENTSGNA